MTALIGPERSRLDVYTSPWNDFLVLHLDPDDICVEVMILSAPLSAPSDDHVMDSGRDKIDDEYFRLESCTNPYQILKVEVSAPNYTILAAYHRLMGVLKNSGTASEHLSNYYRGAYEVIGDSGLRTLYDAASQAGVPDCAKLLTDTESRLPTTSFHSADVYRQLILIWEAKQCHVFKVLVNDLGSPAGAIAAILTELRHREATPLVAFVRAGNRGPDNKGNKVPVAIGFASAKDMSTTIRLVARRPRPQRVRSTATWECPNCHAPVYFVLRTRALNVERWTLLRSPLNLARVKANRTRPYGKL